MLICINFSVLMSNIGSYAFQINLGNIVISLTDTLQDNAQPGGYSRNFCAIKKQNHQRNKIFLTMYLLLTSSLHTSQTLKVHRRAGEGR